MKEIARELLRNPLPLDGGPGFVREGRDVERHITIGAGKDGQDSLSLMSIGLNDTVRTRQIIVSGDAKDRESEVAEEESFKKEEIISDGDMTVVLQKSTSVEKEETGGREIADVIDMASEVTWDNKNDVDEERSEDDEECNKKEEGKDKEEGKRKKERGSDEEEKENEKVEEEEEEEEKEENEEVDRDNENYEEELAVEIDEAEPKLFNGIARPPDAVIFYDIGQASSVSEGFQREGKEDASAAPPFLSEIPPLIPSDPQKSLSGRRLSARQRNPPSWLVEDYHELPLRKRRKVVAEENNSDGKSIDSDFTSSHKKQPKRKRGRGRPRKVEEYENSVDCVDDGTVKSANSRHQRLVKAGRQNRMDCSESDEDLQSTLGRGRGQSAESVRRGRGRPRKVSSVEEDFRSGNKQNNCLKRRRGRPKGSTKDKRKPSLDGKSQSTPNERPKGNVETQPLSGTKRKRQEETVPVPVSPAIRLGAYASQATKFRKLMGSSGLFSGKVAVKEGEDIQDARGLQADSPSRTFTHLKGSWKSLSAQRFSVSSSPLSASTPPTSQRTPSSNSPSISPLHTPLSQSFSFPRSQSPAIIRRRSSFSLSTSVFNKVSSPLPRLSQTGYSAARIRDLCKKTLPLSSSWANSAPSTPSNPSLPLPHYSKFDESDSGNSLCNGPPLEQYPATPPPLPSPLMSSPSPCISADADTVSMMRTSAPPLTGESTNSKPNV